MVVCLPLTGCLAVGATVAGIGFSHQMSGIQYRTFTEALPRVSGSQVMRNSSLGLMESLLADALLTALASTSAAISAPRSLFVRLDILFLLTRPDLDVVATARAAGSVRPGS